MHLTTIVSLLALGAAAAPAAKSLALNTRIPMETLAPSSSSDEIIPELPNLGLRRRQEAEKDPLDAYLETLDGEYDEQKSEEALQHYYDSLEGVKSTVTTSTTVAAQTPLPAAVNSTVPAETEKNSTALVATEKNSTVTVEAKNLTSSVAPEPTGIDPLDAYLATLDGEYDDEKSEEALNHYHDSLEEDESTSTTTTIVAAQTPLPDTLNSTASVETKNETSSVAPEPTKKASSKDISRLNEVLPIKRQEYPEKPEAPSVKRQLDGLLDGVTETKAEDVATPEVTEKNVTTPAVPTVTEGDVAATATEARNATSSAAGNTTAKADDTASDGYHGINKHLAKLDKLPIGGLPVKRGIPTKINNEEVKAPEVRKEDIRTPTTGEEHIDAHPVSWEGVEAAWDERTSRPSTGKNMSKLDWLDLPFKRQLEEVTNAVPKVDEETLDTSDVEETLDTSDVEDDAPATPEVKSSDPAVDETKLEPNTTVNDTVSVVNSTGADTGKAIMDGSHTVGKHMKKVPVNLPIALPSKRQAPEFLSAPVDESEKVESPLHKHLVPLK
jgi:hypothetical protein